MTNKNLGYCILWLLLASVVFYLIDIGLYMEITVFLYIASFAAAFRLINLNQ
jgi:hypothetical protein